LAINARDAMTGGGRLRIEAARVQLDQSAATAAGDEIRPGPCVSIAVVDSGCGMTPEVRARAIEPFFTTKEVGKGSGLGLAMVHGFVKQSGGNIGIDREIGRGTTVRLYLPEARGESALEPAPESPRLAGEGRRVLVVEDDPDVLTLVETFLEELGF